MRRRRALGIVELIIAITLMVTAVFTLISVFTRGSRQAVMSRNRTVAILLCHSLMDELKAHRFGTPGPDRWREPRETPVTSYVEGRPQQMEFSKTLSFANGSFIGEQPGDTDEVTIKIEWQEGLGKNQGRKDLTVKVPVWR